MPSAWEGAGPITTKDCRALAERHGARVVEVEPCSEQAVAFCEGFGIGACLRWPLELELLEGNDSASSCATVPPPVFGNADAAKAAGENESVVEEPSVELEPAPPELPADGAPGSSRGSGSQASEQRSELIGWVESALASAMDGNALAATALAACVDVLLPVAADNWVDEEDTGAYDVAAQIADVLTQEGVPEVLVAEVASQCAAFVESQLRPQQ
jgi:hypothetical protein